MKIIYGIGKVKQHFRRAVVAIGVFDGLHIGHQKLIQQAVRRAKSLNGQAIVLTFAPHPVQVLQPKKYLPYIVSMPYRLKLMERLGVNVCIVIRFTKRFSKISPEKFIARYLVKAISPEEVFVGNEFRFGQGRSGTIEGFQEAGKKYGFKVHAIEQIKRQHAKVGSSGIRQLIAEGKLSLARRHLGRYVSVMGIVTHGDGRGKSLGYPTANLKMEEQVLPPMGVYAVYIHINTKCYLGMANVGVRPSFKKGAMINVETHIFDFKGDLYGQSIIIEFVRKMRTEKKFSTQEQLIAQLARDEIKSRQILTI